MYASFATQRWKEFLWDEKTKYYLLIGEHSAD